MPQACQELRDEFDDDSVAWKILETNFAEDRFLIYPKSKSYKPTDQERRAIQYLFEEWDWAYNESHPSQHD